MMKRLELFVIYLDTKLVNTVIRCSFIYSLFVPLRSKIHIWGFRDPSTILNKKISRIFFMAFVLGVAEQVSLCVLLSNVTLSSPPPRKGSRWSDYITPNSEERKD